MKVASFALGCKVNQAESEAVAEEFAARGYEIVNITDYADIYVINTCSVTNYGDKKSRQILRRVKKINKNAVVVASGCYAQVSTDDIKKIDEVDIIVGTSGRNKIVDEVEKFLKTKEKACFVEDIMNEREFEKISVNKLAGRTRAYIKIQDGCSQFCSYCIIPYARGPIRSRDEQDILDEVGVLEKNGFKEIVLTGIHAASYGKDNHKSDLVTLMKKVSQFDGIKRIRLSSIEPSIVTENFINEIKNMPKLCHHFHLSLQSGCDKTLKAMNRHYTAEKYEDAINMLREAWPDVAITTDIITGFPGETEEDFLECLEFAKKIKFSKIHVFPFSPKKGTPAAKMKEQIKSSVKAERSAKMIKASEESEAEFGEKFIGETLPVLFEQRNGDYYEGHTSNYINVWVKTENELKNTIKNVIIESYKNEKAYGKIIE
ncbi:MAG: tRNA (N(6)-L-threonylcarbamoyladenosine(37)-C(2))-methylthiotransferase MtaB [Clostridia bacterium]|jgi:threonylcarbamoyladenosine tRNA methylthiotransferase MtaB|nr:tRNA (N(6)-L-threonylcarbamoyladenosine(37)-C(2))-methylthiotransferase MtaB [Clostridia bacterium]MCI1999464.1 tRNA (N(6)-L-threonylcarbamoyladenosine(37)-C(2))-methylthiotransferase MtaB [Clostridia bacterium]MCI2014157.1 tRNA (N(6)-L-threonylcarbamoyladenosine(37)-C(2))-methylthiotransferase MtaB [Clostridia bacterium]